MKTLNKYLIPELTSIILDYYYFTIHKENTDNLINEYHKMSNLNTCWGNICICLSDGYKLKPYNYRSMECMDFFRPRIYNIKGESVAMLPKNYL